MKFYTVVFVLVTDTVNFRIRATEMELSFEFSSLSFVNPSIGKLSFYFYKDEFQFE